MSATITARPIFPLPNLAAAAFALAGVLAFCQVLGAQQQAARPDKKQKPATELIKKQAPPKVIPRVLDQATRDNLSVYISLGKQRAYLKVGDEVETFMPSVTPPTQERTSDLAPSTSTTQRPQDALDETSWR